MTPHEAGDSARVTAWFDPGRPGVKRGKLLFKHHITHDYSNWPIEKVSYHAYSTVWLRVGGGRC